MLAEILTKGPSAAVIMAASAWAFYQVYKAIRETKSSSVVDAVSIAQVTQEQLSRERDRTDELFRQVSEMNAENGRLRAEMHAMKNTYESKISDLQAEISTLRKDMGV